MKTYDDLNDKEKQKMQTFLAARLISILDVNHISLIGTIFLAIGILGGFLIITGTINLLSTGLLMESIGANETVSQKAFSVAFDITTIDTFLFLAGMFGYLIMKALGYYYYEKNKKIDYLIFGYDSILDELEIKKSDINDLKKEWKKVKKNG